MFKLALNQSASINFTRENALLPTVFVDGPYSFRFYSADKVEPKHIHVQRDQDSTKSWPNPVRLANNWGFAPQELRKIRRIVETRQLELVEAWDDYFGT